MKDFFGNKLELGDKVAYIRLGYREFCHGEILKFTAKQVLVGTPDGEGGFEENLRYPNTIIKRICANG